MPSKGIWKDKYLVILLVLAIAYVAYWTAFSGYLHHTFQEGYYDIGIESYSMYMHILNIPYPNPLQYLVFANHFSPFFVVFVPIFKLFPYLITLNLIQNIFLMLTMLLIYKTTQLVIKSNVLSFAMAVSFLVDSGVRGLSYYAFHAEAFIPLFSILAIYFYFKENTKFFLVALLLMLTTIEFAFVTGVVILLGLCAYEFIYNSKKNGGESLHSKKRLIAISYGFILIFLYMLLYYFVSLSLFSSYATTPVSIVPPITRLGTFFNWEAHSISSANNGQSPLIHIVGILTTADIVSSSFGFTSFLTPITSLILLAPWPTQVILDPGTPFSSPFQQYYGYSIAASFLASLFGLIWLLKHKDRVGKLLRMDPEYLEMFTASITISYCITISLIIAVIWVSPSVYLFANALNLNYTHISQALSLVPKNASVMAQPDIATHLYYIHNLELPPIYNELGTPFNIQEYWFKPQYIVLDSQLPDYGIIANSSSTFNFSIYTYMGNNYTQIYNSSGMMIYKSKGT